MLTASIKDNNFTLSRERCEKLLWILTLLFPAVLPLKHGVSSVFFFMVLLSIFMLIHSRPRLNNMAKYLLAGFIVFILVSMLSLINAEDMENGLRRIKKLMHFIFLIPIFMAMASTGTNLIKPFLIGVCIGGFVLLGITVYQGHLSGYARTAGFYNEIMFGSVAVTMVLALFISLLSVKRDKIYLTVITLSLFGTLFAAIQSGTKGAWLGLIVGVPLGLGLSLIIKGIPRKRILQVMLASILLASIAGIFSKDEIAIRWNATIQAIDNVQNGEFNDGSIGIRLIMWEAAIKIWYRNPIIGSGIGDFQTDYVRMINRGEVGFPGVSTTPFSYAHSTLFEAVAGTGILGFLGLIASTFLLPSVFFLKALKSSVNQYDRYASVFGLVFVSAFMVFGLTENWLAHSQLVVTYLLLLTIMASRFGAEPR